MARAMRKKSKFREYVEVIVISVVLALIVRTYIVQAFRIPSGSMEDTLLVGDFLLVSKFIYRFTEPKPGDVIVFKYPQDLKRDFIKRCMAVEGQTTDPLVSVPTATAAKLAATATAEPELEPQGLRVGSYGLRVWPPTALEPLEERSDRKLAH